MRQILAILFELLVRNNNEDSVQLEFVRPAIIPVEEICMKAIKLSLDLPMVPIRKFLIIFQIYLRFLFGKTPQPGDIKSFGSEKVRNLKYVKDIQLRFIKEQESKQPRYLCKTEHPVELFYKRNMSADHPIP